MTKDQVFESDARLKLLEGAEVLYNVVRKTLGARGKNVVIHRDKMFPYLTKDGINTIREISLADPIMNMGALLLRQASEKTAEETGDATTSTAVLAYSMMGKGVKVLDSQDEVKVNLNKMLLGMQEAVDDVIKKVEQIKTMPSDQDIYNIAMISSNNDPFIGKIIGDLMLQIGKHGVVVVDDSINGETSFEIASGMKINQGWKNPYLVNNRMKGLMEYENPLVMVTDETLIRFEQIKPFMEHCSATNRPGIIVCADIEGEALGVLIHNVTNSKIKMGVVKAPNHGGLTRDILWDIALYTNATLITDQTAKSTTKYRKEWAGSCGKWMSGRNESTIVKGAGDISSRVEELQSQIEDSKDAFVTKVMKDRLANITGKTAILSVYADTPSELIEKKDRIDDAIHATRAAMDEGIVPGGGITLVNIYNELKQRTLDNNDSMIGYSIVISSLPSPFANILLNAGIDYTEKIGDITPKIGFDVVTETFVDMVEMGIVDPAKSVRVSVKNAFSVVRNVLTTDVLLH